MEPTDKTTVSVRTSINAPVEKVWKKWTDPKDIIHWNNASADWHTPSAQNDLRVGGRFLYRMEAKDGSAGFDFYGTYDVVKVNELIEYQMGDGRKVKVTFTKEGDHTEVVEEFETEKTNPVELQRTGWQTILDNFKNYSERD